MLRTISALVVMGFVASLGDVAQAQGNVEAGRVAAERWCAECHVISAEDTKALVGTPSFFALAEDSSRTDDYLRAAITSPHPPMPNPDLPARTVDDLIAYIRSLR